MENAPPKQAEAEKLPAVQYLSDVAEILQPEDFKTPELKEVGTNKNKKSKSDKAKER